MLPLPGLRDGRPHTKQHLVRPMRIFHDMKHARMRPQSRLPRRQDGVVLFIALIVLVAMTLAGIAMIRSVDTALGIAGNMAFKQATLQGTDRGIKTAADWLGNNSSGAT